jgi:signal transduction histidine kinase
MKTQKTSHNHFPSYEAVSAFSDLARLSQRAGAVFSSPQEIEKVVADPLISQLASYCEAGQAAFLLTTPSRGGCPPTTIASLARQEQFPLLSCLRMDRQVLLHYLTMYQPEGADFQRPAEAPGIVIWRRPRLLAGLKPQLQEEAHPSEHCATGSSTLHSHRQPQALFLFRWDDSVQEILPGVIERGIDLLALLSDAVDAVISGMQFALHQCELERLAHRRTEQHLELLKSELLATVSHELRSPLASIKGYVTTLLRHDHRISWEDRHEFLVAINDASTRLQGTIDQLLELSQLETKTISFDPVPVNLAHLAQEAITVSTSSTQGKHAPETVFSTPFTPVSPFSIEQEEPLSEQVEPVVQGDRLLLRRMLDALLENARFYSLPHGRIEVGVESLTGERVRDRFAHLESPSVQARCILPLPREEDLPLIEIWIKDDGIGIAPEHLAHIFTSFYRVDTSLTREVNGLGLGLSLCRHIVELHGGAIWVESKVGVGSTFHIFLPWQPGNAHIC